VRKRSLAIAYFYFILLLLLNAIGLSPGGSNPALVQTKIIIHKTTTKHKKHKTTK
jgi:hypothetical protein